MKLSNIWKAYASSLIGVVIGVLASAGTAIAQNSFDMKAIMVGAVPAVLLATTDVLKEIQKDLKQ